MNRPEMLIPRPRSRASAGRAALAATLVLVALAVAVHGRSRPSWLERPVDRGLAAHFGGVVAQALADLGDAAVVGVLVLVVAGAGVAVRCLRGAVLAVLAPASAVAVTEYVAKPLVGRHLHGYLTYPSGHITGFAAIAFVVALLAAGPAGGRLPRALAGTLVAVALLLVLGCGLGLVAQGYHYAGDVVGGACLSTALVLGGALGLDRLAGRRRRSDPRADLPQVGERRPEQRRP